ncbi:hypothetical protein EJ02DRAFT_514441 [Clathrospora elynae]|uniref:F-box domain-containing protein n=1 Tax=Clathrospora elynae TaxID=706981 RepID=A0A6A5SMV7_9PLEO|nr:hypothetical protein EJ02DRAFT_514441 [Clathrospora elynae]
MAPTADGTPCDLLRMPFEILKPILAELDQSDQLSIANTCVYLWELAYPMAYGCIVVEIGAGTPDSAWRHLAKGVGLRYVRHLEIRFKYGEDNNPNHMEHLVVCTLIAALRRHQLLSFSLTTTATATVSTKNLAVLLETQQQLRQVSLPAVSRPINIQRTAYLPASSKLRNLRDITLRLSSGTTFDGQLSTIVRKSPNLEQLHLRFSSLGDEHPHRIMDTLAAGVSSKHDMFSLATNLTLQGYVFRLSLSGVLISFPVLRALAVVDCSQDDYLFRELKPKKFPRLVALMIKADCDADASFLSGSFLTAFIRGLRCLRELVIHNGDVWFDDGSDILPHAETLELLSIKGSGDRSAFSEVAGDQGNLLGSFTALRHLGFFIRTIGFHRASGRVDMRNAQYTVLLGSLATLGSLQTLCLRIAAVILPHRRSFTKSGLMNLEYGASLEEHIGLEVLEQLYGERMQSESNGLLEHLSVIANCKFSTTEMPPELHQLATGTSQTQKHMFLLKPKVRFRPADEVKKEMMAKYAGDDYYFLEDYIDSMLEPSRSDLEDY